MSDLQALDAVLTRYSSTMAVLDRAADNVADYVDDRFGPESDHVEAELELAAYLIERAGLDHDAVSEFARDEVRCALGRVDPHVPRAITMFAAMTWVRGLIVGFQLHEDGAR